MRVVLALSSPKKHSVTSGTIPLVIPAVPKADKFIQVPQAQGVLQLQTINWLRKQQLRDCWVEFNGYEWKWRSRIGDGIYEKTPTTIPIHPLSRIQVAMDNSYLIFYDGGKEYTFYSDNVANWTVILSNALIAQVLLQQYQIGKSIARGGSSSVHCLAHDGNDTNYIVKFCPISQRQTALNEYEILEYLNATFPAHEHLPTLLRAFSTKERAIGLVFPKYNGGTLYDRIQNLPPLSTANVLARENSAKQLAKALLKVLKDLHGVGIVHLDVKPSNIMFIDPNSHESELILIDFGISQRINQTATLDNIGCGTPGHTAPELLSFNTSSITSACDVFSAGVIVYTYLLGIAPFQGSTKDKLIERMAQGRMCRPTALWHVLSMPAKEILMGMLDRDPACRLTIDQLMDLDMKEMVQHNIFIPMLNEDLVPTVLEMAGELTQYLCGELIDPDHKTICKIWVDVFQLDWEGDFDSLPKTMLPPQTFSRIRTRRMYARCKEYFGLGNGDCSRLNWYCNSHSGLPENALIRDDNNLRPDSRLSAVSISYLLAAPMENIWIDELYEELRTPVALAQAAIVGGHVCLLKYLISEHGIDIKRLRYIHGEYLSDYSLLAQMVWYHSHYELMDNWTHFSGATIMDHAIFHNRIDMVKYLHENTNLRCTKAAVMGAAAFGHLNMIKYFQENDSYLCTDAEVVEFIHENCHEMCSKHTFDSAALCGYLDIVEYLHENCNKGCTTQAMDYAASEGHFEIVKFLHENRAEGCTVNAMIWAAKYGHYEIVKFLHNNRNEGSRGYALEKAVVGDYLEIVVFLCENRAEGCRNRAMDIAAGNGYLRIVQYLHKHCTIDDETIKAASLSAAWAKCWDIVKYFADNFPEIWYCNLDSCKLDEWRMYLEDEMYNEWLLYVDHFSIVDN